jgi:hypothetical protein
VEEERKKAEKELSEKLSGPASQAFSLCHY